MKTGFEVSFPAIRGIQAGREYYVAMCPLETVIRLVGLEHDNDSVPPQLRAQRVLNKSRVPAIARYMVENPDSYVFLLLRNHTYRWVALSPLPGRQGLAEVTCQQIGGPIALLEFQVAHDRLDGKPFLRGQFVPRHLQIHASLTRPCLDEKQRITSRRPAEDYLGFIDSLAD